MKKKTKIFERKELRIKEGIVYEPCCRVCGTEGFGFHILDAGETLDIKELEEACCPECGERDIEWIPVGYSSGEVIKCDSQNSV